MRQPRWELRILTRNRAFLILIFLYMSAACFAIFVGHQSYQKQILQSAQVEARYQDEIKKWHGGEQLDPGYVGYYQFVPAAASSSPWAALFTGEQAEHNWHLRVRLLALYGQTYAGEIQHYDYWILGGFDLGFVWIYLLPVVIGLLCVNTIADEKHSGRWPLLRAQAKSAGHFLISRLSVNFLVLVLLNTVSLLMASIALDIPLNVTWVAVWLLLTAYQLCWFSVAAFIAHSDRNATFNVLVYCSIWLLAALALPGMHYLSRMNSEEMNLGIAVLMEQREQMNDSWDRDKNADLAEFLKRNPQWRKTAPLPETFHWKWYYAMQNMSDSAVQEHVDQLRTLRLATYRSASTWAWLSPVMSLQRSLSSIAGSDGPAHQHYLDQVKKLHLSLQGFFYPHYFFDQPFSAARLADIPVFDYQPNQSDARQGLLQLGAINLIMLSLLFLLLFRPLRRNSDETIPAVQARSAISSEPERAPPLPRRTSTIKAVE